MARKLSLLLLAIVLTTATSFAETFQIDPEHTQINFSIKHLVFFTVQGNFKEFSGSIQADPENKVLIAVNATIQATSIDTGKEKRDNYLRGEDFFDIKQYPEIHFKSKNITGSGNDITMVGDITIKGITQEIILKGSFFETTLGPQKKLRAKFAATGIIKHQDFKLRGDNPTKAGKLAIGDDVKIELNVESVMQ
ncbi:MAG: polyisoprenoid-binding protein [Deltaproteobacteria bacterium]|nr:MAG: polyisoprenoid-binding protein [Deltaproteobacteria bacterium]